MSVLRSDESAVRRAPVTDSPIKLFLQSRTGILAVTALYAFTIHYAHANYLSVKWAYFGFTYSPFGLGEIIFATLCIGGAALALPRMIHRPSSVVLWQLFVITFIPVVIITLGLVSDALVHYGLDLLALAIGFVVVCRIANAAPVNNVEGGVPGQVGVNAVLVLWSIATVVLVIFYRDIIHLSALDDIYYQRALANDGPGGVIAYVRTYYSGVLSPFLLVMGLYSRRWWLIWVGLAGAVLTYAIDAQKVALVIPAAILALSYLLQRSRGSWASSGFLTLIVAVPMIPLLLSFDFAGPGLRLPTSEVALDLFVFRMVALPGLTFSQYADLFGQLGHTFWSNTRGISAIVPAPDAFVNNPSWPSLGYIVGDYYYGSRLVNVNANPFSGEGVAAAGAAGVLVISVVLGLWLNLLDRVARGWDTRVTILLLVPVGFCLTNGHLATTLVSFGGALWIAVFVAVKPGARAEGMGRIPR